MSDIDRLIEEIAPKENSRNLKDMYERMLEGRTLPNAKPTAETPTEDSIKQIERKVQEDDELPASFRNPTTPQNRGRSRSYQESLDATLSRQVRLSDIVAGLV